MRMHHQDIRYVVFPTPDSSRVINLSCPIRPCRVSIQHCSDQEVLEKHDGPEIVIEKKGEVIIIIAMYIILYMYIYQLHGLIPRPSCAPTWVGVREVRGLGTRLHCKNVRAVFTPFLVTSVACHKHPVRIRKFLFTSLANNYVAIHPNH